MWAKDTRARFLIGNTGDYGQSRRTLSPPHRLEAIDEVGQGRIRKFTLEKAVND
jgi:hypothetical protein